MNSEQVHQFENPDHPIFHESISFIRSHLGKTQLGPLEQAVLERLIHSSGDFSLKSLLSFSSDACSFGLTALKNGAPILVDTSMALAAVSPMASRTLNPTVKTILDWAPKQIPVGSTRTALGMEQAWIDFSNKYTLNQSPVVLIGSSPTALVSLLKLVESGAPAPSLIIGMPVGFIGVEQSKKQLAASGLPYILLKGSRGGAGLAAATVNSLLKAAMFH